MPDPKWIHDMAHKIDIISVREQIQEDLICLLATQFDDEGQMDEVQRIACDIVVSNFDKLLNK